MSCLYRFFVTLFFLFPSTFVLARDPDGVIRMPPADIEPLNKIEEKSKRKKGFSILPVLAANSTYGAMVGGAGVFYTDARRYQKFQALGVVTSEGRYYNQLEYWSRGSDWVYGVNQIYSNFFYPYYENSRALKKNGPDQVEVAHETKSKPYVARRHSSDLTSRIYFLHWEYEEALNVKRANGPSDRVRTYPDEQTTAVGYKLRHDEGRENSFSQLGLYWEARIEHLPNSDWTNIDVDHYTKYILDGRYYWEVYPRMVWANRFMVADSDGELTPVNRYRLGGSEMLRGYGAYRFDGSRFFIVQSEARFQLWGIVSASSFYEFGDISDEKSFKEPLKSYGVGLRIGLPPDYVAKVRFDFGFSREGSQFSMQADQAF